MRHRCARVLCLVIGLLVVCGASTGCATAAPATPPGKPLTEGDYPGGLVDSSALPDGLFFQQRIEARFGKRKLGFSAVLQSASGVLTLLALTPYGSRAFLLEQRGRTLSFTRYADQALPFPPRFILLDVHRTFFLAIPGAPLSDGMHQTVSGGEQITERWQAGRLQERTFRRLHGRPTGLIRIVYSGGMRDHVPATRIDLDNEWFGYKLVIHTLAAE